MLVPPPEEIKQMTESLKEKDEKLKELKAKLRVCKQEKSSRDQTLALVEKLENLKLEKQQLSNLKSDTNSTVDVGQSLKLKAR